MSVPISLSDTEPEREPEPVLPRGLVGLRNVGMLRALQECPCSAHFDMQPLQQIHAASAACCALRTVLTPELMAPFVL